MNSHWYWTIVRHTDRAWRWEHLQSLVAALTSSQPIHHSSHPSSSCLEFSRRNCWEGPGHAIWSLGRRKVTTKSAGSKWNTRRRDSEVFFCVLSAGQTMNGERNRSQLTFNYFHFVRIVLFLYWNSLICIGNFHILDK